MNNDRIITRDVWEAVADTSEEAENLRVRSMLMMEINVRIDSHGWAQRGAADAFGLTQPRVSDLMNGKMDKFSLVALVNIAVTVGVHLRSVASDDDLGVGHHPASR
ncbi:helix-turn-helix domain-containing protein [Corynebacterium variabile]|uniref:helix-turn-helix domain-containing protein n=1 Tax=Corynebacterium variabile TaxID=1727 RepID=UPI003FD1CABB